MMFYVMMIEQADRWDRLQPPRDPNDGLDGIENGWMDDWTSESHEKKYKKYSGVCALSLQSKELLS